jgi:hypothetical protein
VEQPSTTAGTSGALSLGARSVERPADAGWTLVGGIDDPEPARVDRGGLVAPAGADWLVDWWVGADDRWHLPAREPSIRQRRIGAGPIIETSMRVPSGDVVATAYPVLAGGRRATAVEIRNASPVPVALAVALRPVPIEGGPPVAHRLELVDRTTVTVDGRPALLLPRPPNEIGALADRDLVDEVEAGRPLSWPGPCLGPAANAVCLFPLPHDTSLRFTVVAVGVDRPGPIDGLRPTSLPPPETVARGWTSVVERASDHRFPDPGLTGLAAAARARSILAAPGLPRLLEVGDAAAADILRALAIGGHADECRPALAAVADGFPTVLPADAEPGDGARLVRAVAAAADLLGPDRADEVLAPMTRLTTLVDRSGDRAAAAAAQLSLARLAERAGQPEAGRHLRSLVGPDRPTDGPVGIDEVTDLAQRAGPAGSWAPGDAARPAAHFWAMARGLLLRSDDRDPVTIEILPTMPAAWLGGEVEVHRAPVAGVRVSYAIRWHGYRPALLWEVHRDDRAATGQATSWRLTCPGLDPTWSTDRPTGEALLAGSPDELPPAPEPGDSFR